jgi:hypothetical protein
MNNNTKEIQNRIYLFRCYFLSLFSFSFQIKPIFVVLLTSIHDKESDEPDYDEDQLEEEQEEKENWRNSICYNK